MKAKKKVVEIEVLETVSNKVLQGAKVMVLKDSCGRILVETLIEQIKVNTIKPAS